LFEDFFPDPLIRHLVFIRANSICSMMQHYHCVTKIASGYPQRLSSNGSSSQLKLRYAR